jgi:uncharacterized lipoprotein
MAEDKSQEQVEIEHPDLKPDRTGQPFIVTRGTYERVWKPKGWRLATKGGK